MNKKIKSALVKERFFPFECSTSYGVEKDFRVLHWHKEIEICYIQQGTGKYLINGIEYYFSRGDIFLIGNDDMHLCHDDENLVMQVIMFDPSFLQSGPAAPFDYEYLRPFLEASGQFPRKIGSQEYVAMQLAELLMQIETEYMTEQKGYDLMIKALLLQFLALVIRHCFAEQGSMSEKHISRNAAEKVRRVIVYLEEHYAEEISLRSLSEEFGISIPYLCSTFKAFTGNAPIDFLIRYRILMAKTMLDTTEMSVIAISENCGFGSLSNFNHLFKALTGASPMEYRKHLRNKADLTDVL